MKTFLTLSLILLLGAFAYAADPEGCLVCHQYRGLSRIDPDTKKINLFFVDPRFHNEAAGPHGRVRCTGCHERSEVEVFPHKKLSPVSCDKTCHLASARQVETRFGHDRIERMLDKSSHTTKTLNECNTLLGNPLRDGQSRCLLCHDEPTFRQSMVPSSHRGNVERCNVCHAEDFKIDTRFNYWHVVSRSAPARNNLDLSRVCATCHSNEQIKEKFKLPDTSVSYLASFHGKAALLGNQEAASCLDCHVGEEGNVHQIISHKDAEAPTHPDNVGNTCRTPQCHRTAGEQIESAAIHLDLSRSRGWEYLIAIMFVMMILSTFGPSMVITLLKLFHMTIGRDDPDHHKEEALALKLMANPKSRENLKRFTVHQRVQHWFLVITFATLVLTGFPMKFAGRDWAAAVIEALGGLTWVRTIHRYTGALLLCGMVYHTVYILRYMAQRRKKTGESWLRIGFNLPLVMQPKDMKEMLHLIMWLLFLRRERPDGGRFTAEEKFEYFGVFWGVMLLGTTGLLMWFNGFFSRYIPGRIISISNLVHSFEAFLALLHVGILHLAAVIFSPAVFPISPAMFTGDTPPAEMVESHSTLLHEEAKNV